MRFPISNLFFYGFSFELCFPCTTRNILHRRLFDSHFLYRHTKFTQVPKATGLFKRRASFLEKRKAEQSSLEITRESLVTLPFHGWLKGLICTKGGAG